MIYTNYFSENITEDFIRKLSYDQFKRLMNIIFLEGCLSGAKNTTHLRTTLKILTDNQDPNILYFEMNMLSETYFRKLKDNS